MLCIGLTTLISGIALWYGVVRGILPTTGITLPFISAGGTSMIRANFFALDCY